MTNSKKHPLFYKCLLCQKQITPTEFLYEDYFTIFRGHNAQFYEGKPGSEAGFICFECGRTKLLKRLGLDKNGAYA